MALYKPNVDTHPNNTWASQVGQDKTIVDIFNGKNKGYFVDLASNDAIALSNTLALERFNWTGLCIEPNPMYIKGYFHRKCQLIMAVVGPMEDEVVSFKFDNTWAGGIVGNEFDNKGGGNELIHTVSVEKILTDFQAPSVIDYMSLDIEGAEAWAFQTFPWDKFTFLVLTIERPKPDLVNILVKSGYIYLCNHGDFGDQLWVHPHLPDFERVASKYKGRQDCQTSLS